MDLLPKVEAADRLKRLKSWMQEAGVDAVFVLQNADLFYFSGTVQVGLLCLPAAGEPLYLVQKSAARARMESPWDRIVPVTSLSGLPGILAGEGIGTLGRIGLELDVLPTSYYLRFQRLLPGVEFVDASEPIRMVRMIKSAYEVDQIRKAGLMLKQAFRRIPEWMHPGATELEIAARLEGFLRSLGHQGITRMHGFNCELAFGTLSSGASATYPTCFPGPLGFAGLYPAVPNGASRRRLAVGEPLMVDVVGGYGGYIADKTRTFVLGELPPDMMEAHEFARSLLAKIESMLKPGVPCKRIYRFALEMAESSPYASTFMGAGDNQVRFVGHGVGLELDELPVLAGGSDIPLQAGMTIAIEPKIFFPDRGGVGIENTYAITTTGHEKLTPFPEDIITVGSGQ